MNNPAISEIIKIATFLISLAAILWKAASLATEIKILRRDLDELKAKVSEKNQQTDRIITTLTAMLNDIKVAVTRIETKIEHSGGSK